MDTSARSRCPWPTGTWPSLPLTSSGAAAPDLPVELRAAVEGYNRDDCLSALRLHTWLEERRSELEAQRGSPLPRPDAASGEASDDLAEEIGRVREVMDTLLAGVPDDAELRDHAQRARYVLAHLLEWHRREDKSTHWEYFRLCDLPEQELLEDRTAIGGLTYEGMVGREARSLVHRYRFPPQDQAIDRARQVHDARTKASAGTVVRVDAAEGILELKRGEKSEAPHPTAVVPYEIVPTKEQRASLLRLGEHVARAAVSTDAFASALALLYRSPPRAGATGASDEETAILRAMAVEGSVLPVQGPPGTGKTYLGARMIVALLRAGRRVGITANSHRVITRLLDEACEAAGREGVTLHAIQKPDSEGEDGSRDPCVTVTDSNRAVRDALEQGTANLAAGTSWLWARSDMAGLVDVLVVDEAGQMSLANVLAAAPASRGIILLGDPQQLDQPQKGVHPPGVAVSALGHILGGAATMSVERGSFLEETWRMHPDVCSYISEVFYEGRLRSRPDLSRIRLGRARAALRHRPSLRSRTAPRQPQRLRGGSGGRRQARGSAGVRGLDMDRPPRCDSPDAPRGRARGRPVQCARRASAQARAGDRHRNGGQVPGAGGARRDLLDGDVDPGRSPARGGGFFTARTGSTSPSRARDAPRFSWPIRRSSRCGAARCGRCRS